MSSQNSDQKDSENEGGKTFEELESGMKVLFNERKTPLKVVEKNDERAVVEGPNGGRYEIYMDEEALLVSREGNRKYSSYCKQLRSVGEWVRNEDTWTHTHTGAEVSLREKDTGFWSIETKGLEENIETPLYGYSDKEFAEEDALKFIDKHPEGE